MDCANQVGSVLTDLRRSTLNACWKAVWPECVKSRDFVIPNTTEFPYIITLAHIICGEGFDDLLFVDIDELIVDKLLSEEEIIEVFLETPDPKEHSDNDEEDHILNTELIQEGLELVTKLGNDFGKYDPNEERAEKFQPELKSLMAFYRELHKGLAKPRIQQLITQFLKLTETSAPQESSVNLIPEITEDDDQDVSSNSSDTVVLRKRMCLLSLSDI